MKGTCRSLLKNLKARQTTSHFLPPSVLPLNDGFSAAIAERLLDAGADPDYVENPVDTSPLALAVRFLREPMIVLLLSRGADPASVGENLLLVAAETESLTLTQVRLLGCVVDGLVDGNLFFFFFFLVWARNVPNNAFIDLVGWVLGRRNRWTALT